MSHNTNNKIRRVYHPEHSCVTVTLTPEYDFINDASEAAQLAYALLDKIDERVFWILDTTAVTLPEDLGITLDELIIAMNTANSLVWHHPKVRQVVVVTKNHTLELAFPGLNTPVFGNLDVKVVPTLDDALAYVRSQIGK